MNTHEVLIEILQNKGPSTILELSELACLTKADIRYHMKGLLRSRQVSVRKQDTDSGRGRPSLVYSVTEKKDIKLLTLLSSAMFFAVKQTFEDASADSQFSLSLMDNLAKGFKPTGSINMRLRSAVNYLADMGIHSRWEASKEGPQIKILKESISNLIPDQDFSLSLVVQLVDRVFLTALG
jgi:predicted ArsR family transcriptional regulator